MKLNYPAYYSGLENEFTVDSEGVGYVSLKGLSLLCGYDEEKILEIIERTDYEGMTEHGWFMDYDAEHIIASYSGIKGNTRALQTTQQLAIIELRVVCQRINGFVDYSILAESDRMSRKIDFHNKRTMQDKHLSELTCALRDSNISTSKKSIDEFNPGSDRDT